MKIPYFAKLSEDNGEEWLSAVFEALEVETYDFSQYSALGIDPVIDYSAASQGVELPAVDTKDVAENRKADDSDDDKTNSTRVSASIEEIQTAGFAKQAAPEASAKSSANGDGNDNGRNEPHFDNARYVQIGGGPSSSDWNRHLVWQITQQQNSQQDERFSAGDATEPSVVGLNGAFHELKLSALDDKIYTTSSYDGGGKTTVNAGDGTDTLFLTTGGLKADLGGLSDFGKYGGKVELRSVENVIGSDGADTINGNNADNKLAGGGGDDKISGGGGNDTISGGPGKNNLSGDGGSDKITGGNGVDTIDGGAGNDTITGQAGADKISGGEGADEIKGGADDDAIDGDGGDDDIEGGAGDDEINGGGGDDVIDGGAGTDTVDGGAGDDEIDGGEGDDEIDGGEGADTLNGDEGNDTVNGGDGADDIDGGDGNDQLNGDAGADTIVGAAGTDTINGGADADDIDGGADNDVILGGDGNDVLKGGAGDDTITGGAGGDTITGGAGADMYIYAAQTDSGLAVGEFDVYTDFDIATDKFDLQALLAGDTFEFLDAEGTAFTGTDKEVRWDKNGGRTIIEIDLNADGNADMKFELDDEVNLTDSNFIL